MQKLAPQRTFILLLIILILLSTCQTALGTPLSCFYDPNTRAWTLQAQQTPASVLLSVLASRARFELVGPLPSEPKISLYSQKASLQPQVPPLLCVTLMADGKRIACLFPERTLLRTRRKSGVWNAVAR